MIFKVWAVPVAGGERTTSRRAMQRAGLVDVCVAPHMQVPGIGSCLARAAWQQVQP